MSEFGRFQLSVLPGLLGLVGFVEPCSIGSAGSAKAQYRIGGLARVGLARGS